MHPAGTTLSYIPPAAQPAGAASGQKVKTALAIGAQADQIKI